MQNKFANPPKERMYGHINAKLPQVRKKLNRSTFASLILDLVSCIVTWTSSASADRYPSAEGGVTCQRRVKRHPLHAMYTYSLLKVFDSRTGSIFHHYSPLTTPPQTEEAESSTKQERITSSDKLCMYFSPRVSE